MKANDIIEAKKLIAQSEAKRIARWEGIVAVSRSALKTANREVKLCKRMVYESSNPDAWLECKRFWLKRRAELKKSLRERTLYLSQLKKKMEVA